MDYIVIWRYYIDYCGAYSRLQLRDLCGEMNCISFRLYGGYTRRNEVGYHREPSLVII